MVNDLVTGEVEASIVGVFIATWDDTNSEYTRDFLGLTNKDDLSVTIDESTEDFTPSGERRTRRYRTNNEITFEVTQAADKDFAASIEAGLVQDGTDGVRWDPSTDSRRFGFESSNPSGIEFGMFKDDIGKKIDDGSLDVVADSEVLHRFEGVKIMSGDIDPSATPETISFEGMVEGAFWVDYTGSGGA